jgi:hypothetical protein
VKANHVKTAILATWCVLVAWLIRYEAFPEFFTQSVNGYSTLLSRNLLVRDTWMKVIVNGMTVGYSFSGVTVEESGNTRLYTVANSILFNLGLPLNTAGFKIESSANLDGTMKMTNFTSAVSAGAFSFSASGEKGRGNTFALALDCGNESARKQIQVPEDTVLLNPLNPLILPGMHPGGSITMKVFDTVTMKQSLLLVKALRTETIELNAKKYRCTVLSARFPGYPGMDIVWWTDKDGNVVRQKLPGITLEVCDADTALALVKSKSSDEPQPARRVTDTIRKYVDLLKGPLSDLVKPSNQ